MLHPNLDEFRRLAKPGALVPVYREIVADLETPVTAYMKVSKDERYSFLLESVERAESIGRYSFLGANPSIVFRSRGNRVDIIRPDATETFESDYPLGNLRELMAAYQAVPIEGLPVFHGGAVGYISYDHVRFFERLPDKNPDPLNLPDLYFMITDTILIFDHAKNRLLIVSNAHVKDNADAAYSEAARKIEAIEAKLRRPLIVTTERLHSAPDGQEVRSNFTRERFCEAVEQCKEYIRAGDVFQVVLSQRFERNVYASATNLYRALRCINPSPYMTLVQYPEFTLVGASPEVMTRVEGKTVMVRPIAGTRKRGANAAEDAALAEELIHDEKELAEHVMLVDLGRNDIGRVSDAGTVRPTQMMVIEKYSHVMHIVSQVEGRLKDECDAFDALRATFPMGTVSGAPKIRAMEIIDEVEDLRRGPYSGGCGYISFSGDMDTCIILRTIVLKDGVAHIQAGAGLVYDSDPGSEYEESINKAKVMFKAIELAEQGLEL
jgi:anthranilate synthase component 1